MAVENKYVNDKVQAGKVDEAQYVNGQDIVAMVETEELAAGDSNASVYRFFKGLNPNLIPIRIDVYGDAAITDANDCDLGFYKSTKDGVLGAVISKDVLADALDIAGISSAVTPLNGLNNVDIANRKKKIYELCGHTVKNYVQGYDLALTANTGVTTTGGTVTIVAWFIKG